jgi:hypothetical protein
MANGAMRRHSETVFSPYAQLDASNAKNYVNHGLLAPVRFWPLAFV